MRFGYKEFVAVLSAIFVMGTAYSANSNIPDPSLKGPYDVGFVEIEDVQVWDNNGAPSTTVVRVFYPIPAGTSPDQPGIDTEYYMNAAGFPFTQPSPINAVRNAEPAPGTFKLVVFSHGGSSSPPPDSFGPDEMFVGMETLASHGFVALIFPRRAHGAEITGLVPSAIDVAVQTAVEHEIGGAGGAKIPIYLDEQGEPDKMGLIGHSAGAFFLAQKTIGTMFTPDPDSRFAAAIYLDTIGIEAVLSSDEQLAATNIPYMQIRGSMFEFLDGGLVAERSDRVFEKTSGVSPRYQLFIKYFSHREPFSGECYILQNFREIALSIQPDKEPFDFRLSPSEFNNPISDGVQLLWGRSELPRIPDQQGTAREFCQTAGVDGSTDNFSVDTNGDGFQDAGAPDGKYDISTDNFSLDTNGDGVQDFGTADGINDFYTNLSLNILAQNNLYPADLLTANMPMGGVSEDFNSTRARYEVSFFKVYLENDRRYEPFLTPGFANSDDRVTLKVTGGNGGK